MTVLRGSPNGVRDFFDSNVDDYETKHYGERVRSFMTVRQTHIMRFVDSLSLATDAMILDAGCGPGHLLTALATGGRKVHGLDASAKMLRHAKTQLDACQSTSSVSLQQGNVEELPYADATFDLICSAGVIEYLHDDKAVLAEFFRVLRPGGHLILAVTNMWSPVNYLDCFLEFLKRQPWLLRRLNLVWTRLGHSPVLPRHFQVRRHRPAKLQAALVRAGFAPRDDSHFYFLPWPHPLDRLFPKATAALGNRMEGLGRTWLGPLAEGYLTLSAKT